MRGACKFAFRPPASLASQRRIVSVRAEEPNARDRGNRESELARDVADSIGRWLGVTPSPQNEASSSSPSSESQGDLGESGESPSSKKRIKVIKEWSSETVEEDWDEWSGTPPVVDLEDDEDVAELREKVIARRVRRAGVRSTTRDEYLRPIVDPTGIYNRVLLRAEEAEERVFVESITNQYESREAIKYAGVLVGVPLAVGFVVSRLLANPLWDWAANMDANAFALSDMQKVEGAEAMHREEIKLRMISSLGQAPDLTDEELIRHLHDEALAFSADKREENKNCLLNIVSDSTSAAVFFVLLCQENSPRAILFRTIGRVFGGLSDTAKAFLIILVTDTLLGYHSEEGWTAALSLISRHYGLAAQTDSLQLFVATVPVLLDSLFKYWIFVELNKIDPAAAVTLRYVPYIPYIPCCLNRRDGDALALTTLFTRTPVSSMSLRLDPAGRWTGTDRSHHVYVRT